MTIYKYKIPIQHEFILDVPQDFRVIHVGIDPQGDPCLWATVTPDKPTLRVLFFLVGTGHQAPSYPHIGTVVHNEYVWHLFQRVF